MALRVPVFVAVSLALGIGAHVAAHGLLPAPGRVLFVAFAVAVLCAGLQRSELCGLALTLTTGVVQAGIHIALADGTGAHAGMSHAAAGPALPQPAMLLAHVLAALGVCWWLRRGEAAAWRAVRRLLPALPDAPAAAAPASVRLRPATPPVLRPAVDRSVAALRRRGPPVPHAV